MSQRVSIRKHNNSREIFEKVEESGWERVPHLRKINLFYSYPVPSPLVGVRIHLRRVGGEGGVTLPLPFESEPQGRRPLPSREGI